MLGVPIFVTGAIRPHRVTEMATCKVGGPHDEVNNPPVRRTAGARSGTSKKSLALATCHGEIVIVAVSDTDGNRGQC